jgi:hypothetical protein
MLLYYYERTRQRESANRLRRELLSWDSSRDTSGAARP